MNDEIRIIPITTKKGLKTFIQFHYDLYRDHKFAIPFLRFDEMNTLDPKKNPAFEFCEAQYFLAVDSEARIVGRIAAIINHRANEQWNKKQVRFGWFDFVDNVAVSCALLRAEIAALKACPSARQSASVAKPSAEASISSRISKSSLSSISLSSAYCLRKPS